MNKHLIELMTEGHFTTLSVYFESALDANKRHSPLAAPERDNLAPRAPAWERPVSPVAQRYQIKAEMNVMSPTEMQRMLGASFPFIDAAMPAKCYIYKVSKELAAQLTKGDRVIIPGSDDNFIVGKVWQVHPESQIDYDAPYEYKWVVQKVDTEGYYNHMRNEANFRVALAEAEKAKQRDAIRASVLAAHDPGSEAHRIFSAALAALGVQAPAPAPAAEQAAGSTATAQA